MSSREIGFTANLALRPGQKVEMTVSWPVMLDRTCGLKLVICGHVLHNDASMAVVKIEHYEFHTRAAEGVERLAAATPLEPYQPNLSSVSPL